MNRQLQTARDKPNPSSTDSASLITILRLHHCILTLGQIARGFPDLPQPLPAEYNPPPVEVFQQMVEGVLASLDAMSVYKIVRDAVSVLLPLISSMFLFKLRI